MSPAIGCLRTSIPSSKARASLQLTRLPPSGPSALISSALRSPLPSSHAGLPASPSTCPAPSSLRAAPLLGCSCLEHSSPSCPFASLLPLLQVFFSLSSSQRGFPWLRFATPCLGLLPSPSLALFSPLQRLFILAMSWLFGLASPRLASKCLRD